MSNTINVKIETPKVWTEVLNASTVTTGVVSIAGNGQHCIGSSVPSNTLIGHRFTGELETFSLEAGESLYACVDSVTTIIVTED